MLTRIATRFSFVIACAVLLSASFGWPGGTVAAQGAPVVTDPGHQTGAEDTTFSFAGIELSVESPDASTYRAIVRAVGGDGLLESEGVRAVELSTDGDRQAVNAFLSDLSFEPADDWFGDLTIDVEVQSNLSAPTGNTTTLSFELTIAPVPDRPTTGALDALPAVAEDTADPASVPVASRVTAFADVDGDDLAGVAVSDDAATAQQGVWQYSTDGGASWFDVGVVSPASALLLPGDAQLRFLPAEDRFGTPGRCGSTRWTTTPARRASARSRVARRAEPRTSTTGRSSASTPSARRWPRASRRSTTRRSRAPPR
ncbi:MAG: hypothetical protein U5J97_11660 [Trueperaceae bacterium]|nr:hypothetical protein [Trueperaceae bacterium]